MKVLFTVSAYIIHNIFLSFISNIHISTLNIIPLIMISVCLCFTGVDQL